VQDGKARRLRVKIAPGSDGTHPQVPISEGLVAGATVLTLRGAEPNEGQLVAMPSAGVGAGAGAPASATPVNAATVAPAAVKS
jgi:hypothetical protein